MPQIGTIVEEHDHAVTVEWWIGGYSNAWVPWKRRGKVVREKMPRTAILLEGIQLTKANRLKPETVQSLKSLYSAIEFI